ncbi:hypothetical protein [Metabacillus indicus]|uniref:hypothetical protein n=1 Tax=Metabacillus indicus TaxID=246786 RepID=UPI00137849B1|nr:hypothetical protein [Metabacillus indicus]
MSEINMGGLRLDVKAIGIDETLEKLNKLNELLKEANSLKNELANSEISIQFKHQSFE